MGIVALKFFIKNRNAIFVLRKFVKDLKNVKLTNLLQKIKLSTLIL